MRQRSSKAPSQLQNAIGPKARLQQRDDTRRKRLSQEVKSFLAVFVITICVGYWLILLWKIFAARSRSAQSIPSRPRLALWGGRTVFSDATILDPLARLKLPTPIIVVGLPKSGTTSISGYFSCGRIASSHFKCEISEDDFDEEQSAWRNCRIPSDGEMYASGSMPLCGVCVRRNIIHGRPPLEGCGPYKVWAELDTAEHPLPLEKALRGAAAIGGRKMMSNVQPLCLYPQIMHLQEIHGAYPNSTFILNTRPVEKWISSISKWNPFPPGDEKNRPGYPGYLREVLTKCDFPGFPSGVGGNDQDMKEFYNGHSERIRNFVENYPSHTLVELNIENDDAGSIMEEAFGISSKCWMNHNPSVEAEKELGGSNDEEDRVWSKLTPELMDQVKKEKPATQLVFEYPLCTGIEDIYPPKAKDQQSHRK